MKIKTLMRALLDEKESIFVVEIDREQEKQTGLNLPEGRIKSRSRGVWSFFYLFFLVVELLSILSFHFVTDTY